MKAQRQFVSVDWSYFLAERTSSSGVERAVVEHFYEGVGRGAQAGEECQHPVHLSSRHRCHRYRHRGRGVVTTLRNRHHSVVLVENATLLSPRYKRISKVAKDLRFWGCRTSGRHLVEQF